MTLLQTVIYHPTKAQKNTWHKERGKPAKPCGHGNQEPCAVPLSDYIPLLVILGILLAIKKLRP